MGHPRRLETGNRKRKTIAYPEVSLPPPAPPPFPPEEAGTSEVGKKYKNNPSAWVGLLVRVTIVSPWLLLLLLLLLLLVRLLSVLLLLLGYYHYYYYWYDF